MLENETLENEESKYFSYVIPYHRFDNSGLNGIYSYWYSIYPYEHQPSGSCNMNKIDNVQIELQYLKNIKWKWAISF